MAEPLVTCIVIFLDEERFLAEAIDSVQAQTYPSWEIVLVDDGSSDRSTQIARDHAQRFPDRIRYVEHPGHETRGMSAARNLGLAHARGQYIGFLDADDTWEPNKLKEQVGLLDMRPDVGMVYGRTLLWHSWRGDTAEADEFCDLGVPPDSTLEPPESLLLLIENRAQTPTTCNALMRRSVFDRSGGFEPAFRGMFEDQVFFMKLGLARARVRLVAVLGALSTARGQQLGTRRSRRPGGSGSPAAVRLADRLPRTAWRAIAAHPTTAPPLSSRTEPAAPARLARAAAVLALAHRAALERDPPRDLRTASHTWTACHER
jgi:glycosyltransferase involved in cell wall biosynthesis